MRENIISELKTIAETILTRKEEWDLKELKIQIAELYEKITVLDYLNSIPKDRLKPTEQKEKIQPSLDSKSYREINWFKDPKPVPQSPHNEEIAEPLIEKIKDIVAEIPRESGSVDDVLEKILTGGENEKNELKELISHYRQIPEFERKSGIKELNIGIDDRSVYIQNLFGNSTEEYERILSQVQSMGSYQEIEEFINHTVKPDYDNWIGKEEFLQRFLMTIKKNFP